MTDISSIGIRSIQAYQAALTVTSQNIANYQTEGYSRRTAVFTEAIDYSGVDVTDVRRMVNEAAVENLQQSASIYSQANNLLTQLTNFAPLFDDQQTGIGKYITDSLANLNVLNGAVNAGNRQLYLDKLNSMVGRMQSVSAEVSMQQKTVNQNFQAEVTSINSILSNIASINGQIVETIGTDQSTLLDQRDQYVLELQKFMNVTTSTDPSGSMNVTLTNGMPLVLGLQSNTLLTVNDPNNPADLTIALNQGGTTNFDIEDVITTGKLAADYQFRSTLEDTQNAIGRLALAFSDALNTQNQQGMDGYTNLGGNLFTDINTPEAMTDRAYANLNNTGTGEMNVQITDTSMLTTSNYQMTIGAGNTYTITRLSDNKNMGGGTIGSTPQAITVEDGFTVNLTGGSFNAGDIFTLSPTSGAVANMAVLITDPKQIALASPVSVGAGTTNIGSGQVTNVGVTNIDGSGFSLPNQLNPPITVQFDSSGTTYSLIDTNTGVAIESGIAYTSGANVFPTPGGYDPGYQFAISGTVGANDTFNITYNSNGVGDSANGRLMAALYSKQIVQGGTLTFNDTYRVLTGNVASATSDAQSDYNAGKALLQSAQQWRQQTSGVSMEQETLNLSQYQFAYQACAQIIEAGKNVFDTILSLSRR